MKKLITLVVILLSLAIVLSAVIIVCNMNQFKFELNEDGQSYTLVKWDHPLDFAGPVLDLVITDLKIPAEYKDLPVTVIGNGAFVGCTAAESITIPDSVTTIDKEAFASSKMDTLTISNSVTYIGDNAFEGCENLTSVILPDSITHIGYNAFWRCSKLTEVRMSENIFSVGYDAFLDCPDSLFNVKNGAYYLGNDNNPYLVLVNNVDVDQEKWQIEESTEVLADGSFFTTQTKVVIPKNVRNVGKNNLSKAYSLENILVDPSNENYSSYNGHLFSKNFDTLIAFAKGQRKERVNTDFPVWLGIKTIGEYAFSDYRPWATTDDPITLTIPATVTTLEKEALFEVEVDILILSNYLVTLGENSLGDNWSSPLIKEIYFIGTKEEWKELMENNPDCGLDPNIPVTFSY